MYFAVREPENICLYTVYQYVSFMSCLAYFTKKHIIVYDNLIVKD